MQAAVEQLVRETMQWSPVDQMRLETVIAALTQARQTRLCGRMIDSLVGKIRLSGHRLESTL